MREILFRGKVARDCVGVSTQRKYKKGTWVFGDLSHTNYDPPLIDQNNDDPVPVAPTTVGQYTGLTDKNGKLIFEGDIVGMRVGSCYEVKYGDGCFYMDGTLITSKYLCHFEVVGNIHDNPELLEGGTNNA